MNLHARNIDDLVNERLALSESLFDDPELSADSAQVVVSPYRFNPLGAHIDHQGGQVMARTLDQYTIFIYWASETPVVTVHARLDESWETVSFGVDEPVMGDSWQQMLSASVAAMAAAHQIRVGITGVVHGTLVSGGLSSSASVVLAYLVALADANGLRIGQKELVELVRRVENDFRGLNNGIQDQMSIAFGKRDAMTVLDVNAVTADVVADPVGIESVQFLMCFSGVTRDLGGSAFNTRVAECCEAAGLLSAGAAHLGEVPIELRGDECLQGLPAPLGRRARHVYTEMQRVDAGKKAWATGNFAAFGQLMNASCLSSINDYESGSEWLIALHELARELPGVLGNRFSGGGYGGCLFMLVETPNVEAVADTLLEKYLSRYPDMKGKAFVRLAQSEDTVRLLRDHEYAA